MVAAFIVVKILDYIFEGVTSSVVSIVRLPLFVVTWTAVTATAGMNGVTKRVRQIRRIAQRRI